MCGGGHTGHGGGQNNLLESTLSYRVGPRDQGYQAQQQASLPTELSLWSYVFTWLIFSLDD